MDLDLQGYPPPKSQSKVSFSRKIGGVAPTLSLNFTNKNMKFNPEIAFFFWGAPPPRPPVY